MAGSKRTFTNVEIKGSRFVSVSPSGAASKAYSAATRGMEKKPTSKVIELKETTRDSKGKTYKYKVERITLKKPVVLELGCKTITKKFTTKVTSMN